jgi:transcriptional regulator with XRE-family HTH domain
MTLRELIQHRQTTGAALGRALGWSRATVSDYVTGRRRPKLETAARIAAALDAVVIVPRDKGAPFGYAPEPVTNN